MRMRSFCWAALLGLAACQPQDPTGAPAPAPADAPKISITDFSQPMTALGTEPFWSLKMEANRFVLRRPDAPDMIVEAPGAMIEPGRGFWIARGAKGEQLSVTLTVGDCSDGMSDRVYPMRAEVAVLNQVLKGCADKTDALTPAGAAP